MGERKIKMTKLDKSGYRAQCQTEDVLRAAHRWRIARMNMVKSNMKSDNRSLLDELGNAEDALSKAVGSYEGSFSA